jgi:hypothetical protein
MTAKKLNLATALQNVNTQAKHIAMTENPDRPQSRQGKKAISGFFDPAVSKQLKQLALDQNITVQALLAESLNDLFVKHGHKPIA